MLAAASGLYVLLAACSAAEHSGRVDSEQQGSGTEQDASLIEQVRDAASALVDAVIHPVADANADPITSGSRLKRKVLTGADGSRQVDGYIFRDTLLQRDCSYSKTADGQIRCLPNNAASFVLSSTTATSYFTDSGCSVAIQAVAIVSQCIALPDTILWTAPVSGTCPSTSGARAYQRGNQVANLYFKSGTSCVDVSSSYTTGANRAYALGAEIPLSTYVLATESVE